MPTKKSSPTAKRAEPSLVITRIFNAPRRLVFEAWTKKIHLDHWSAPAGFTIPFSEGDARPGGAWRATMRSADGEEMSLSGVYREVVPYQRLVFTHAWEENGQRGHETIVTVRFSDIGGKTKMIFRQGPFESIASRDGHKGGWSECFERLATLLKAKRAA